MKITPVTPPTTAYTAPRVDFVKSNFDAIIWQKGYKVVHEIALPCPCSSKNTNQLSSCVNCGGTRWLFVNAKETRMVLSSMNMNTKFKEWSQENIGHVSISAMAEDECSLMDRITVLDGKAILGESLFLKTYNSEYYWNTVYNIKEVLYIAIFINKNVKLQPLKYGVDFTVLDNKITFLPTSAYYSMIDPAKEEQDISITIRYKHEPQFYIMDIPRETMQTIQFKGEHGQEESIDLPVHCIGRRSHYQLDMQSPDGTRIIRNDHDFEHDDINAPITTC